MQLKLHIPEGPDIYDSEADEVMVRSENDIRTAGFAVARSVREWLRRMPFVPATVDLQYHISAEVVPDEKPKATPAPAPDAPRPKRKRKASK